ncbi:MAG: hypothetical protein ACK2VD_17915 [Anaerolineae bacterium]|jgi:hypothetical protein
MVMTAAWWGLGYGALLVAVVTYGRHFLQRYVFHGERTSFIERIASQRVGESLSLVSAVLLGAGTLSRALKGHGWPIITAADAAGGIALLALLFRLVQARLSRSSDAGLATTSIALLLLSYSLARLPSAPVTVPLLPIGSVLSDALDLGAGGFLAVAAAFSLAAVVHARLADPRTAAAGTSPQEDDPASEVFVRAALLCLAGSLAVDTWWLQKVGLGRTGEVQQAGIAIVWMVYFVALRLRSSPRWRGWPWASVVSVGFVCALPILLDVPWLNLPLPI